MRDSRRARLALESGRRFGVPVTSYRSISLFTSMSWVDFIWR